MTDATLISHGDRPVLRFERFLRRPIEDVWRAVTDPAEMRAWFPTRIEIDHWETGAVLTHHFDGQAREPLPGTVLDCSAPHRLSFTWGEDTITFELSPAPGGTTFILSEQLGAERAARNAAGWEVCLERLVESPAGEDWSSRFDRYSAAFEPLLGTQERSPASTP